MAFLKNLHSQPHFHSLKNPKFPHSIKTIASSPQIQPTNSQSQQTKKPLSTLFNELMSGKTPTIAENSEGGDVELKNKLKQLTEEVKEKNSKKNQFLTKGVSDKPETVKRVSLYSAFTNLPVPNSVIDTQKVEKETEKEEKRKREPFVFKELSIDMVMFLKYLYEKGYFKDAKFCNVNERFDLGWFENRYASGYAKFAAVNFARHNLEISKWLSASALKQVAVFGCPSTDRSVVFPAKRLRKFFEVPENTVCSKCMLRESCKFANQNVWKCDANKLDLEIVTKVIISYALNFVHPQLVVSDEVNKSVNHLLNEFVKLSQVTES